MCPFRLLTIVTIVKNAQGDFERTAESIGYKPDWCEWVVVDGASTDGTVEAAERYRDRIDYFISEKDSGIAAAFNKGIQAANGRYIIFINAGDTLARGFYQLATKYLTSGVDNPVVVGRIRMGSKCVGRAVSYNRQLMRNYLPHQAMFIARASFTEVGMYNESFRLGMDYEWSLRLRKQWGSILFVSDVVADMAPGGASMSHYRETFRQYDRARRIHGVSPAMSYTLSLAFTVKRSLGNVLRQVTHVNRGV